MNNHAIKIEDLNLNKTQADEIEAILWQFLDNLGFPAERIEPLDCRSRDGFMAYSHNKGGLAAIAYRDQYSAYMNGTGFESADATLKKYQDYNLEYFLEAYPEINKDQSTWNDNTIEMFDEYCMNAEDSTVLYGVDLMLTGETELNVRLTVCVKDSPYHRQYDDLVEIDIEFKSLAGLKQKLNRLLNQSVFKCFSDNLREAF